MSSHNTDQFCTESQAYNILLVQIHTVVRGLCFCFFLQRAQVIFMPTIHSYVNGQPFQTENNLAAVANHTLHSLST